MGASGPDFNARAELLRFENLLTAHHPGLPDFAGTSDLVRSKLDAAQLYRDRPPSVEGGVMSIQDGTGSAASARVTGESNVGVEARSVDSGVVVTLASIGTSSTELVAGRADRKQIEIQNLDPSNNLHILPGSGSATTDHLRLGPGERWYFPPGVTASAAVQAVASGAATKVVVHEYT